LSVRHAAAPPFIAMALTPWPLHSRAFAACAMVVGAALCCEAVRIDGVAFGAGASGGSLSVAARAPAEKANEDMDRGSELDQATEFVNAIDVRAIMTLSDIRSILYRLDDWRTRLLKSSAFRKSRTREAVKELLREIKSKAEQLQRTETMRELEGDVDDGGDDMPSQRENICKSIEKYDFDANFSDEVKHLCEALDAVRAAVSADRNGTAAVADVSARLATLRSRQEYALPYVSSRISTVLAEEWRWVRRQLAQRAEAASIGGSILSPPDVELAAGLDDWLVDVAVTSHLGPMERDARLRDASLIVNGTEAWEELSLDEVNTCLYRLEVCQNLVAECIVLADPVLRGEIREVLHALKASKDALAARAEQLEASGAQETVLSDLSPSQRDNICKHLEELGLERDLYRDVRRICQSMDKLHAAVLTGGDHWPLTRVLVARLTELRQKPGYDDLPVAKGLEAIFAQEWRWLASRGAVGLAM